MDWWKSKHNTHHAAPNELADDGARVVDPDIDTLPLLVNAPDAPESSCVCLHNCSVRLIEWHPPCIVATWRA